MSGGAQATGAAHGPAPPIADDPKADVHVTPQHPGDFEGATEHKIEYRDEDGNILNDEQVAALEGKVSFQTRYETRTRVVDEQGNEVWEGEAGEGAPEGVAGTKIEGVEQETVGEHGEAEEMTVPGAAEADEDLRKEAERATALTEAEPESEPGKETGRDEL